MKNTLYTILLILFIVVIQTNAQTTFFVTTDGNDNNDGTGWLKSKLSIQSAIDAADGILPKGQVFVRQGTYTLTLTGIEDSDFLSTILYPNPVLAGNEFVISADEEFSKIIEIINVNGAVYDKYSSNSKIIRIAAPATPGIYFVRIINGSKFKTIKVVVE